MYNVLTSTVHARLKGKIIARRIVLNPEGVGLIAVPRREVEYRFWRTSQQLTELTEGLGCAFVYQLTHVGISAAPGVRGLLPLDGLGEHLLGNAEVAADNAS